MRSYTSSQHEQVYKISEKLTSILSTLESDDGLYADKIEKRIASLENSIYETIEQDNKKFKVISEKTKNLQQKIQELKSASENFFKLKVDALHEFEEILREELQSNDSSKMEYESKFGHIVEDRVNSLNLDLSREFNSRKEGFNRFNDLCRNNIGTVKDLLKKELLDRDENSDKFVNGVLTRIKATKEMIALEKEAREKIEESMLAMLQELVERMEVEIESERTEREENEETLLSLLEDTCSKLIKMSEI